VSKSIRRRIFLAGGMAARGVKVGMTAKEAARLMLG
jgi:hypothetical protein